MKSVVNWIGKEIRRRELEISKRHMAVGRPAVRRVGDGGRRPRAGSLRDETGRTVENRQDHDRPFFLGEAVKGSHIVVFFFTWRTKESNR